MEPTINTDGLKSLLEKKEDFLLFDVRRKSDYEADPSLISGAEWHDPEDVEKWSKTVPENKQVVIYCVKGGSVSKSISENLLNKKIGTRYLEGGINAWKDSGGQLLKASGPGRGQ